ncbi:hypothetical protein ACNKHR_22735 [Shigella flexneri]
MNLQTSPPSRRRRGIIQATINNELYEIRMFRSQVAPRTRIFRTSQSGIAKCW